jgi:hypothetical protein
MGIISWTTPVRIVCSLGVRVMNGLLENGRTDGFETDLLFLQAGATHTQTNFSTTSSTKSVSRFSLVDSSKEQKFFSLHRGDKSLA